MTIRGVWAATKAATNVAYKAACLYLALKFVVGFYAFFEFADGAAHAFYTLQKGTGV